MTQSSRKHIWDFITITAFVSSTMLLAIFLYWILFPYKTADIQTPIKILNQNHVIRVGEKIQMKIVLDKYTDVKPEVSKYVVCTSGNTAAFDQPGTSRPLGHTEYIVDNFVLPPKFVDGENCKFVFKSYYKVNPIRTIVKEWYSESFTVKE